MKQLFIFFLLLPMSLMGQTVFKVEASDTVSVDDWPPRGVLGDKTYVESTTYNVNGIGQSVHVERRGITAASGKYIKTNYNPSTQAINYLKNAASIGVYSRSNLG